MYADTKVAEIRSKCAEIRAKRRGKERKSYQCQVLEPWNVSYKKKTVTYRKKRGTSTRTRRDAIKEQL